MSIPGAASPLFLTSAAAAADDAAAFQVDRSLRFNPDDTPSLSKTFSSAGNRTAWSWSAWVKKADNGKSNDQCLFGGYGGNNDTDWFEFGFGGSNDHSPADKFYWTTNSTTSGTTALYRDNSGWYHCLVTYDGSNIKVYINSTLVLTSSKTGNLGINGAWHHSIGKGPKSSSPRPFDGYMADVHFVDGSALAPTDFGELDANNNWNPKAFTGSHNAARTNLGGVTVSSYVSGPVNSTKPLSNCFGGTIGSGYQQGTTATAGNALTLDISSLNATVTNVRLNTFIGGSPGTLTVNGSNVSYSGGGDEQLVVAVNGQLNTIVWGYDNGNNYVYMRGIEVDFDDGNGYQLLEDGAGAPGGVNGFHLKFSDNSANAALGYDQKDTAPELNPKSGFDVVEYTGDGSSSQAISGLAFQPDFVWLKSRSEVQNHAVFDVVRGVEKRLHPNLTQSQDDSASGLQAFNSDGFTVGSNNVNGKNGVNYVAWCWKAGGAAVTNTDGTITSQVSANTDYGFSIVTYTGSAGGTVGHGLGSTPKLIIAKSRTETKSWPVYTSVTGKDKYLVLSGSNAEQSASGVWGSSAPTSTVFGIENSSTGGNVHGDIVAYCWSEVSGFSKFGSYTGTGAAGVSVTTGFKPRWVLIKETSQAQHWFIYDTSRGETNILWASSSASESQIGSGDGSTQNAIQIDSDGFTIPHTLSGTNRNGSTYFYAAFGDLPGNHFDVNNLVATTGADGTLGRQVSLYTGNDATQHRIGGVVYSDAVPTADGFRPGRAAADGFDGSLSTYVALNNYTFNLDVGSWGLSGTLEVYTGSNMQYAVDGGSASSMNANDWTTVGNANAITTLTFTRTDGNYPYFYAIRLDGEYLIDGDGGQALQYEPDLVWVKNRDQTEKHVLVDSVRGVDKALYSSSASAEDSGSTYSDRFVSFNSDGFNVGSTHTTTNSDGDDFAAWSWSAGPNSNKTYTVKVVSDSGNKYRFDDYGSSGVTLDLQEGSTYIFDQSDSSNSGHPIRFGTSANGTDYTTGVTHTGTPGSAGAKTTLVLGTGVSTLYYSCLNHSGMGGQINTNSTAGASNFDGSIQAVVKASDTHGFSIMRYLGNATAGATVGHGLSKAPEWIIGKNRGGGDAWWVWFKAHSSDASKFLKLNTTNTESDTQYIANDTAPSSSVVTLGSDYGWNSSQSPGMIMYAWTSVPGYSKFGTYTGSSSLEITTGFKVQWLLLKSYAGDGFNWVIIDDARGTNSSGVSKKLYPNLTGSENSDGRGNETKVEFTDTGFKFLDEGAETNSSSRSYVYAAFAGKPPSEIIDSMVDSPSNYAADSGNNGGNYATFNPLVSFAAQPTLSNGNLDVTTSGLSETWRGAVATMAKKSGKWYAEFVITNKTASNHINVGINPLNRQTTALQSDSTSGHYYNSEGQFWNASSYSSGSYEGYTKGDVVGVAVDMDSNNDVKFYRNGVLINTVALNSNITTYGFQFAVAPYAGGGSHVSSLSANFGATPFKYTPPAGYKSVCTQNLPAPTIADGSTAMDVVAYTGTITDTSSQTVTGLGFQSDLVWIKRRDSTNSHQLVDSVRGAGKWLESNSTGGESTSNTNGVLTAFNANGFTLTGGSTNANLCCESGFTYAAWAWNAGSSTVTNQDGTITSSCRANASAGISIVSYTGTGSNATVGHSLSAAPELILLKDRSQASGFSVYHSEIGTTANNYFELQADAAAAASDNAFQKTAPTNSVFSIGTKAATNESGINFIAYCFAPVAGFSAFG